MKSKTSIKDKFLLDCELIDLFGRLLPEGRKEVKNRPNYGWHDLRKNPNDLPPYNHRVLATDGIETYITFRDEINVAADHNGFLRKWPLYNDAIAWMELPQFNKD